MDPEALPGLQDGPGRAEGGLQEPLCTPRPEGLLCSAGSPQSSCWIHSFPWPVDPVGAPQIQDLEQKTSPCSQGSKSLQWRKALAASLLAVLPPSSPRLRVCDLSSTDPQVDKSHLPFFNLYMSMNKSYLSFS